MTEAGGSAPAPQADPSALRVRLFEDRLVGLLAQALAQERGLSLDAAEPAEVEKIEREALAALHGNAVRIVHAQTEAISSETLSAVLREQRPRRLRFGRCLAAMLLGFAVAAGGAAGYAARRLHPPAADAPAPVPAPQPDTAPAEPPAAAAAPEAPPAEAPAPEPVAEPPAQDPPPAAETPAAEQPPPPAPAAAPAEPARTGTIVTRAGGRTNIRSAPSLNARVVATVGPGTVLSVFGEARDGWLPVGREAPLGWLRQSTLDR